MPSFFSVLTLYAKHSNHLQTHHVDAPLVNKFCSSFFACGCAQMKLTTKPWHPKPCHERVVSSATNSFISAMHSVHRCLVVPCTLNTNWIIQVSTNKRAISKVAFGHHTFGSFQLKACSGSYTPQDFGCYTGNTRKSMPNSDQCYCLTRQEEVEA